MKLYEISNISAFHYLILALMVFRVTRFFLVDQLFHPVRDAIWDRFPPESSMVGYFFTCSWCMSGWISFITVLVYILFPSITLFLGCIFSLSAIAGLIAARLDV